MDFYTEYVEPMLRKAAKKIEETPAMQAIVNGTMTKAQFRYYYLQDHAYLCDYIRSWATALAKTDSYQEIGDLLTIINDVYTALTAYRKEWGIELGLTEEEMDNVIMGEGKRSYTAYLSHIAHTCDVAGLACAVFPCGMMYTYFAEDLLPTCKLDHDDFCYRWLAYFTTDSYKTEARNKKAVVNAFCEDKSERERKKLLEIIAYSCNYEIWQWTDAYWNNTTWALDEIFPKRSSGSDE